MADFIEYEAMMHLIPGILINPATPYMSGPFPFLQLPREIRDSIYYYALLRPRLGSLYKPSHIYLKNTRSADRIYSSHGLPYHGTEGLFLANRQISMEAREIFYSTFHFNLSSPGVNTMLQDTFSSWTRSLITSVGFQVGLMTTPLPSSPRSEERARQAIEIVVNLFPNIKRVVLTLSFTGLDVSECQVKDIKARALKIASPLKSIPQFSLEGPDFETKQRTRIYRELREDLACQ